MEHCKRKNEWYNLDRPIETTFNFILINIIQGASNILTIVLDIMAGIGLHLYKQ